MVPVRRHARHWRAYLACGGLVLAGLLVSAAEKSGQQEPSQHNARAAYHDNSTQCSTLTPGSFAATPPDPPITWAPLVIEVKPSAAEVEAVGKEEAAKTRVLGLEPDLWVAIFTLFLTAATTALWAETARLRRGADDQQRTDAEARRTDLAHLQESLDVARQNARSAMIQSQTAERAFLDVERPYIRISDVSGVFHSNEVGGVRYGGLPPNTGSVACYVSFRVQNIGRMPATIHQVKFRVIYETDFPEEPDYRIPNLITIDFDLSSNQSTNYFFSTNAVEEVVILDGAIVEPKYIFFYGLIIYGDMFGGIFFKRTAYRMVNPKRFLRVTGNRANEEKRFDKPDEFVWLD